MDDRNSIWNNNNDQLPEGWGKRDLPDSWGKQSTGNNNNSSDAYSSRKDHNTSPVELNKLAGKARSGLGRLAGAVKNAGEAAGEALGSGEVKKKFDTVKKKAISVTEKVHTGDKKEPQEDSVSFAETGEDNSVDTISAAEDTLNDTEHSSNIEASETAVYTEQETDASDNADTAEDTLTDTEHSSNIEASETAVYTEQETDASDKNDTAEDTLTDTEHSSSIEASETAVYTEQETDASDKTDTEVLSEPLPSEEEYSAPQNNNNSVMSQADEMPPQRSASPQNTGGTRFQSQDMSYQRQYAPPPMQYQNNYSSPPPAQQQSDLRQYPEHRKPDTIAILLAVIVILLLGIAVLGGMFLLKDRKNEPADGSSVSADVTAEVTDEKSTEAAPETETGSAPAEKVHRIVAALSKEEVYSKYLEVINGMEFIPPHRGFLTDLNSDGIKEMIIPDVSDMTFKLYYCDGSTVKSHSFGSFMALDNFVMFSVDGSMGKKYIYYRDNYAYRSSQGYISMDDLSEIDISITFTDAGSGTADWKISFDGTELFAEGTDNVSTVYGETTNCYANLLEAFKEYGFSIYDSSMYNSIDGLYKDDLIKELGGSPMQETTNSSAARATASVSVEPQAVNGNGTCLLMTVNGNYSYYTYEIYADCEGERNTLRKSGTSYDRTYTYEDGSTVSNFVFCVTPYNADGTAGDMASISYNGAPSLPPTGVSSVTSCTRYGTIYSPSGRKIDGFSRSYIIDGGAASFERHDLTHGWHVTAVNQYFDGTEYWYELYDSDDGDYYGWVEEHDISFY